MKSINQHTLIIGSGFSGLGMAIALKKFGRNDFTILEQADDVGGTWRDNTYPGAACDVPSHVYSFSFEPNPSWTSKFSPQKEILSYLQHCARKYSLLPHIQFNSRVERSVFDQESGLWTVYIKDKQPIVCRFLVIGSGGLSRPSYPKIPGLENFRGTLFHSARWDHKFLLENARVGIIGTGASSIQIVPAIAGKVGTLSLFQRTPAWIMPKAEKAYSSRDRSLMARIPGYQYLVRKLLYWQFELRAIGVLRPSLMRFPEKDALALLAREVKDEATRKKLTPQYTMGCKRILLSNDFYTTFNRPNVHLVSEGIERITAEGIRTKDGQNHKLDAIICATGFQVAEASAPFPVSGLNGIDLGHTWKDGAEAYLGTTVSGFPNLFILVGPNTGLGHNSIVFMIESQIRYIAQAIQKITKKRLKYVDVKAEIQRDYNQDLVRRFEKTVWTNGNCVSWYHTHGGKNTTLYPGFSFQLRLKTHFFKTSAYHLVTEELSPSRRTSDIARAEGY